MLWARLNNPTSGNRWVIGDWIRAILCLMVKYGNWQIFGQGVVDRIYWNRGNTEGWVAWVTQNLNCIERGEGWADLPDGLNPEDSEDDEDDENVENDEADDCDYSL